MTEAGYGALFFWSFLAATLIPIGSEAMVVLMSVNEFSLPLVLTVATLGNTLGAVTTYWIARTATRAIEPKGAARRALEIVSRYGYPALLFSWVPLIGDAIVAAAGAAKMAFVPFVLITALGKLLRYAALIYLTVRIAQ